MTTGTLQSVPMLPVVSSPAAPRSRGALMRALAHARKFLLPFVFLFILFGGGLEPKPAQAFVLTPGAIISDIGSAIKVIMEGIMKAIDFMSKLAKESGILKAFEWMYDKFNEGLTAMEKAWRDFGVMASTAIQGELEAQKRATQAKADVNYYTPMAAMDARTMREQFGTLASQTNTSSKAGNGGAGSGNGSGAGGGAGAGSGNQTPSMYNPDEMLCFVVTARQLIPVMIRFKDIVSRWIIRGNVLAGRGVGEDEDGPKFAAKKRKEACGDANKGDPPVGNPLTDPPECRATGDAGSKAFYADYMDASYLASILRLRTNSIILPKLERRQIKTENGTMEVALATADEKSPRQQLWIAANDFCRNAAGPRPTPAAGASAKTREGRVQLARFYHCIALQSNFQKQCVDRLAYLTRPNCDEPQFKTFCEESNKICKAALAHGTVLPSSFDNCEKGLSLYEAEYVAHSFCSSSGRQITYAAGGKTIEHIMTDTNYCSLDFAVWSRKIATEDQNLMVALQGLRDLKDCWADVRN